MDGNSLDNKYYTPDISEFHVGFEYEEIGHVITDKGWHKIKEQLWSKKKWMDGCDQENYINAWYLTDKLKSKLYTLYPPIRVKYLDAADIESLGFTHVSFDEFKFDKYELYFTPELQHISILIQPTFLFQGTVKNKSQLKVLLKQLGITETI